MGLGHRLIMLYQREITPCIFAVHGGWSRWSGWGPCSKSCGTGSQERSRSCTQPAPKYGGKSCPGTAGEKRMCNKQACPGKKKNY